MFTKLKVLHVLVGLSLVSLSIEAGAVELKMFVNEPQGGRCSKDIKYAMEILRRSAM